MDEFNWEKVFMPFLKEDLAKRLEISQEELELLSLKFLNDALRHIAKGGCVNFTDYKSNNTLYSIPIKLENLPRELGDMFKYSVDDFLGHVIDRTDYHYNKICKINWHDWQEYGIYAVSFGDNTFREMPDDKPDKFLKYFRRPMPLNPITYPTFENFILEFKYKKGNLQQLQEDYQILFDEPLPEPKGTTFSTP